MKSTAAPSDPPYARYVGRIGALALALGIGGAIVTSPNVALADDNAPSASPGTTSSKQTETQSDSSTPDPKPADTSAPAPTGSTSTTQDSNTSASSSSASPGSTSTSTKPSGSSPSEVVFDDSGVIIRSSGGAHGSGKDELPSTDDGPDDADKTEPTEPDATGAVKEPADSESGATTPRPQSQQAPNKGPAAAQAVVKAAPKPKAKTTGTTPKVVAPSATTAKTLTASATLAATGNTAAAASPSALVTAQPATAMTLAAAGAPVSPVVKGIRTMLNMVATAVRNFLTPSPGNTMESPLLWAVLAWTRQQWARLTGRDRIVDTGQPVVTSPEPLPQAGDPAQDVAAAALPDELPSAWTGTDVGAPTVPGSAHYSDGTFTVTGAGTDIWGAADQFHYVHQDLDGDGEIIAQVTSQDATHGWAKSGVMIKASTDAGAPYVLLATTPGNGVAMQYGFNGSVAGQAISAPWLKLTRAGDTVTGYTSADGVTWTTVGTATLAGEAQIGLFVTSHSATVATTSTFENVAVTSVAPPEVLPSPWTGTDVGAPTMPGSAGYADGTFTVSGAGTDIWGAADQFHYVHQDLDGDGEIIAEVTSQDATHGWAKSGVMIKTSTDAGAPYVLLATTPGNGVAMQFGFNGSIAGPVISTPTTWLKLTRAGDTVTGYTSADGVTWTTVGTATLAGEAQIGLFVTSHSAAVLATSTFENVSVTVPPLPSPWTGTDVGTPAAPGSAQYSGGTFTVTGAGTDVWGVDDQFHYVHQDLDGDGEIIAQVTSQDATQGWAKSGVMIKTSTVAGAPYVLLATTPGNGITMQYGFNGSVAGPAISAPWLKLTRIGETVTGYASADGITWTTVGTASLAGEVQIGLFVTSHDAAVLSTSTFDNVAVTNIAPPKTVPAPWTGSGVGAPTTPGSAEYSGGTFTITGAGTDIWGADDQFQFVHQGLSGDGEIVVQVTSQDALHGWAKSGVMIKTSTEAGTPYVLLATTPGNGVTMQYGFNGSVAGPAISAPWLKLSRAGDTVTGYASADGITWTTVGTATLAGPAQIGMFVTSHDATVLSTSTFTHVSVTSLAASRTTIAFGTAPRIGEKGGTVMVPIVRTGDLNRVSTVQYGITSDTAIEGQDFIGGGGTVTMDVGVSRVYVPVQILDDNVSESTETFVVSIINVDANSTLLFPRTARIDILDDENPVTDPVDPPLTSDYDVTHQIIVGSLNQPLSMEFAPQDPSLIYVAEKGGVIKVFNVNTGALVSTFIDIESKVNSNLDRGLLDFTFHPQFGQAVQPGQPEHNYLYAFYVVDPPDSVGNPDPNATQDGGGNRFAYVVRFTADAATNYTTVIPGSEVILVGAAGHTLQDVSGAGTVDSTSDFDQPESGFDPVTGEYVENYIKVDSKSHAGGSLAFGPDGALYVAIGDGTSFDATDPRTLSVQNINSLSGKILRIDPVTGLGLPDNPFVEAGDSLSANHSKVYQLGLRNPFAMGFTEDGRLFISNTGWWSYEEIESGNAGANFGWPYFEGGDGELLKPPGYQDLPADPARDLPSAADFYLQVNNGQITITTAYRAFAHWDGAPGFQVQAIVGVGAPYTGTQYPAEFQNDIFFVDVVDGEVFVVDVNNRDELKFLYQTWAVPISFTQGPDGYVYVANLGDGTITRMLIEPKQSV